MFARLALALLILTAAIGCGGGSGSPVPDDGSTGSQELMVGNLSLRGSSPSEPAVVSANQTTVTSLSGDFSGVRLRYPSNLLENAQVVYGTEGHTLFSMDGDGARSEPYVTGNAIQAADYNPAGTKLYYGDSNLYVKTLSTGAVATLATGNVTDVAVSPNGAKIAYITYGGFGFYTIWVANADGSSATNVGGYSGITAIDWISNSKLVFTGSSSIRSINTDGSGVTTVISGDAYLDIDVAPDLTQVAFVRWVSGEPQLVVMGIWAATYFSGEKLVPDAGVVKRVVWTPDSRELLFTEQYQSGLYHVDEAGSITQLKATLSIPTSYHALAVSPYVPERSLVQTGTTFGARCSAVLLAQQEEKVSSVTLLDATTRLSTVVTPPGSNTGTSAFVFRIEADKLTKLMYSVDSSLRLVSGLPTGTFNGALVSVSSTTGFVNAVLPYNVTRGLKPTWTAQGSQVVFSGDFGAAFDGKGKNVARGGASAASLDSDGNLSIR